MIDEKKLIERLQRCVDTSDNSNFTNGLLSAIDIVNQQPKIGEWIPCSERLPECDGEYICTQEAYSLSNGRLINRTVESVEFCDGEWRRAKHLKVIAWMSLPEPYTENPNG